MIGPTFCDCIRTLFFWQQTGITEKFRDLDLLDFKNNPLQTSELDSASGKFSIEVYNFYAIVYSIAIGTIILMFLVELHAVKINKLVHAGIMTLHGHIIKGLKFLHKQIINVLKYIKKQKLTSCQICIAVLFGFVGLTLLIHIYLIEEVIESFSEYFT